jgi:hypothetical protein
MLALLARQRRALDVLLRGALCCTGAVGPHGGITLGYLIK